MTNPLACVKTPDMEILTVDNLVKHYHKVKALAGVSFSIQKGVCFGILGPNGAGKTTTMEIIEGVEKPDSGEVYYKGKKRTDAFLEEVGIQFQATILMDFLTVGETLKTFRNLYQNPMNLMDTVRICRLEEILDRDNAKISGGQKQRLLLAMALINDPEIVILDEPTTGLDPQARRHLWRIVERIREDGKTIVLTTHYMDEAQMLCDDIVFMDKGRIIAQGAPAELMKGLDKTVTVIIPKKDLPASAKNLFTGHNDPFFKIYFQNDHVEIQASDVNPVIETLLKNGADLNRISVRSRTLEDLFLHLAGEDAVI